MTGKISTTQLLLVLFALLLLTGFTISCVKEVDEFIPFDQISNIDLKETFGDPGDTLEYSINGLIRNSFYTQDGSYVILDPESFEFADGSPCSCNLIQVRVIELSNKKDLIIYESPTLYSNRLLDNFKTFFISASSEGRPLHLRPNQYLTLITPSLDPNEEMQLFFQDPGKASIVWKKAESTTASTSNITSGEWETDKNPLLGYKSKVDQLGWFTISKIKSEEITNTVHLSLDKELNMDNTSIFAISTNSQSVLQFFPNDPGVFNALIPLGTEVVFLGISKNAANSYTMAFENTVIQSDHTQSLTFYSKSLEEIRYILESL